MPVTESVSSFKGFSDAYPSCATLRHELARLFDKCEFDQEETHTISFNEATKRLRIAVEKSISAVDKSTKRKVSEFRIGKTYVKSQSDGTFNPMQSTTWGALGGTSENWSTHKNDNYDGLIAVGCVTNELIPKVIKEENTAIHMDHQMYALMMAQSLVHHYMVQEPDGKLRNKSSDIEYCSEGKTGNKGSIIYIAYKLELETISEISDVAIKEEEPEGAASTALPDDTGSPFKQARATQEDQTLQGTSREKNPEVESEKGPNEKRARKNFTKDEKRLILCSYISLTAKSDWKKLADFVYKGRRYALSTEMTKHYDNLHTENKLKDRIKSYIQKVQNDKAKESDQEILDLMKLVRSNEPAASP